MILSLFSGLWDFTIMRLGSLLAVTVVTAVTEAQAPESHSLGSNPVPLLTSFLTAVPQFPHLEMEMTIVPTS